MTLSTYGITPIGFHEMVVQQAGRCAICREEFTEQPAIDHDHRCCSRRKASCGKCVRGLLCTNCNNGLGRFSEDPVKLLAAASYLSRVGGAANEPKGSPNVNAD